LGGKIRVHKLAGQTLCIIHTGRLDYEHLCGTNHQLQPVESREELRRDEDRRINELIGRLTNSLPRHCRRTNKTLLSSPKTFQLNRAIYVDSSHVNLMVAVFTAMGLFKQINRLLDTTKITEVRTWIISKVVPFSGWMTVDGVADYYHEPSEDYVRVLKSHRYARNGGFRDFKKCNHTGR
jgi:hypothetical protein